MIFDQHEYEIRCEWGLQGLSTLAPISDAVVIVDVLSFTTSVDIATHRGALVFPYGGDADTLEAFAAERDAIVAQRHKPGMTITGFTLSPASLMNIPHGTRLVLPSPNGSTLSSMAGDRPTFAGCLRNAEATAKAAQQIGGSIVVIAGGERWKGDWTLRPSLEDMLGAGAIIHHLQGEKSPEAQWAEATFLNFKDRLLHILQTCSSGKELIDKGLGEDVKLAAAYNASPGAPHLIRGAYEI